ncbi:MAG: 6-carboxytetrahydropterin synthase QueD [Patescibacteria group bacterium]|nr:6-carboxytetrahydropterin synthase QueD [Patescibacteria group bacterium]
MLVSRDFKFDAAHYLPKYHGKCEKLHGHTYKLRVTLEGEPDSEGMVFDFAEIKRVVAERVLEELDHSSLNDVMENPSAENIAMLVWERLFGEFGRARLHEVRVWETEGCFVSYLG